MTTPEPTHGRSPAPESYACLLFIIPFFFSRSSFEIVGRRGRGDAGFPQLAAASASFAQLAAPSAARAQLASTSVLLLSCFSPPPRAFLAPSPSPLPSTPQIAIAIARGRGFEGPVEGRHGRLLPGSAPASSPPPRALLVSSPSSLPSTPQIAVAIGRGRGFEDAVEGQHRRLLPGSAPARSTHLGRPSYPPPGPPPPLLPTPLADLGAPPPDPLLQLLVCTSPPSPSPS
jgi:hypothetical protein